MPGLPLAEAAPPPCLPAGLFSWQASQPLWDSWRWGRWQGCLRALRSRGIEKWDGALVLKLPLPLGDFELP